MRVVFVDNLLLERNGGLYDYVLQPHLGLISLIAVIESAGHKGILYDPKLAVARDGLPLDRTLYRQIARDVLRREPDVVGMTSLGCNFICTLKVASYLKRERPDLPILLGGPHATVLDRAIVQRFPQFDLIVRNEAELKILPLLAALEGGGLEDVPGITHRRHGEVVANAGEPVIDQLDALPLAAYDHYPIAALGLTWLRIEAGRGCPFFCSFCSTASFFGRRYRLKSASRLCAEMDRLHAAYGVTHFSLTHDLFTVNRKKVIAFCDELAGRTYTWKCSARMDCVDPELLERMSAAGCREIYFGVETGSARMQKISQKRLDLSLFAPTLDSTERLGMTETVSFITGYPQEEKADQDDTLDLIGSCFYRRPPPHYVQLHLLTPEPGTQLLAEFAAEMDYDGYVTDFNFPTLEDDDALVMRADREVFVNHHHYRGVLPRRRHVVVTALYGLLCRLGSVVLSALLDRYGRRLSRLMDAILEWGQLERNELPVGGETLCDFCRATWGEDDSLTSLVRYKVAAMELAKSLQCGRRQEEEHAAAIHSAAGRQARYRLAAGVVVLRDLHDCPEILARWGEQQAEIAATSTVSPPRRSHYLLLADGRSDVVRNFELSEESAVALEAFTGASTIDDVAARLAGNGVDEASLQAFVGELLALGALQAAASRAEGPASAGDLPSRAKSVEWGERAVAVSAPHV